MRSPWEREGEVRRKKGNFETAELFHVFEYIEVFLKEVLGLLAWLRRDFMSVLLPTEI